MHKHSSQKQRPSRLDTNSVLQSCYTDANQHERNHIVSSLCSLFSVLRVQLYESVSTHPLKAAKLDRLTKHMRKTPEITVSVHAIADVTVQ